MARSNSVERPMEARWLTWGRSGFAVGVVLVLVVLGLENMALRPKWQEVEDGVNWAARLEGVTAVEIVPGSAGEAAGIRPGDVLEQQFKKLLVFTWFETGNALQERRADE